MSELQKLIALDAVIVAVVATVVAFMTERTAADFALGAAMMVPYLIVSQVVGWRRRTADAGAGPAQPQMR